MLPAVVFATPNDLPTVVDEIYRRLREGSRVLAVVSALAGETDRLLARAREILPANVDMIVMGFLPQGQKVKQISV